MKKLRAWHLSILAILITSTIIALVGPTKLSIGLLLLYIMMFPALYFLEKKKKLPLWQERIAFALIVYPIAYLITNAPDFLNFFIASLIFSAILLLSEKWKDKDKEMLPEWEGEKSENNQKIEETSENKIL